MYNNDEGLKRYLRYKSMGKSKFVIVTTLLFVVCIFFAITPLIFVANYFGGVFSYPTIQRVLLVIFYTVILIFYGIKRSERLWDENAIRFEGIDNIITEIEDDNLKRLILSGNRIMAVKRYKTITNAKFNVALRYVNLMNVYYSNHES